LPLVFFVERKMKKKKSSIFLRCDLSLVLSWAAFPSSSPRKRGPSMPFATAHAPPWRRFCGSGSDAWVRKRVEEGPREREKDRRKKHRLMAPNLAQPRSLPRHHHHQPKTQPSSSSDDGTFLDPCFQDEVFVMLPLALLVLALLLFSVVSDGGDLGRQRQRQRRRRRSSRSLSVAFYSSLAITLSGVFMLLSFCLWKRKEEAHRGGGGEDTYSFLEALLLSPPHVVATSGALAAAGAPLTWWVRRRRHSSSFSSSPAVIIVLIFPFLSSASTLVAAGSSWVSFFSAEGRERKGGGEGGAAAVERSKGGGDASLLLLLLARACCLSLASASLWAFSVALDLARREEQGEEESEAARQREPLLLGSGDDGESDDKEEVETRPTPPPPPKHHPRPSTSWSMSWVSPLLSVGSLRQLTDADLFSVPEKDAPQEAASELARAWRDECRRMKGKRRRKGKNSRRRPPSLARCVWKVYGARWLSLGVLKLFSDSLNFAGPMLLNALVGFVTPKGDDDDEGISSSSSKHSSSFPRRGSPAFGFAAAALLALAAVLKAFLNSRYSFGMASLSVALRSALGSAVHGAALAGKKRRSGSKSSSSSSFSGFGDEDDDDNDNDETTPSSSFNEGDVATLASVDVDRAANGLGAAHELWSQPLQIAAALLLLYTQLRFAFLAGLAVVVALIPLNKMLATRIGVATREMMFFKGARLAVVADLARGDGGATAIKASGWELAFGARVRAARAREVRALAARKLLDALCVYFWACSSLLVTLSTLGAAALSSGGGASSSSSLGSAAVFTSLALFGVLVAPLNALPWVLTGVIEASVSLARLQGYFGSRGGARLVGEVVVVEEKEEEEEEEEEVDDRSGGDNGSKARVLLGFIGRDEHAVSASRQRRRRQQQQEQQEQHPDEMEEGGVAVILSHASFSWSCSSSRSSSSSPPPPPSPRHHHLRRRVLAAAPQRSLPTLCDISLTLNSGHLVAVVGATGSGKSSLIAALAGVRRS